MHILQHNFMFWQQEATILDIFVLSSSLWVMLRILQRIETAVRSTPYKDAKTVSYH